MSLQFVTEVVHELATGFVSQEESSSTRESTDDGWPQPIVQAHYSFLHEVE